MARFTALTGDFAKTGLFIVYQIPSILPIAIPISALITSFLLFQQMSRTQELTAFRAAGLSLGKILTPLLFLSTLLSLFNFSICASVSPYCRREGKKLIFEETSQNPLVLLQRQKLINLQNGWLDVTVENETTAKDLLLIAQGSKSERLGLIAARDLSMKENDLLGKDLAIVSFIPTEEGDTLVIENQNGMSTAGPFLSSLLKKNRPNLDWNAFDFKMLYLQKELRSAEIEMLRRLSLAFAVFSFTLLGCAFGIEEGRNPKRTNLFFALSLMLLVLLSYFLGKGLKSFPYLSAIALLGPHPFIWICSSIHLYRITKGRLC